MADTTTSIPVGNRAFVGRFSPAGEALKNVSSETLQCLAAAIAAERNRRTREFIEGELKR